MPSGQCRLSSTISCRDQRFGAEPEGRLDGGDGAEKRLMASPVWISGSRTNSKLACRSVPYKRGSTPWPTAASAQHVAEQGGDARRGRRRPKAQKIGAPELPAELLANLVPASRNRHPSRPAHSAMKVSGKKCSDLGRLDLEPARRKPAIAYAIPIRVKLPARWLLHNPTRRQNATPNPRRRPTSAKPR